MDTKEFEDSIHMEIHAVRRIPGYKPTIMERNMSKFVIEHFTTCKECQAIRDQMKNKPVETSLGDKLKNILHEN